MGKFSKLYTGRIYITMNLDINMEAQKIDQECSENMIWEPRELCGG